MTHAGHIIPDQLWADVHLIWDYHQLRHEPRPSSAAIALGSYDLGVATFAATLFKAGLFPVVVFTGANSPTTVERFPDGEAVQYRRQALSLGVPDEAILVEPHARHTGENISLSRHVLERAGRQVDTVLLITMPYMQRRAYATCRQQWPDVKATCASEPISLENYIKAMGDDRLVVDELVGDLQRIIEYPKLGFAIEQAVPAEVKNAFRRLVDAGFDSRILHGQEQ